mmetsp:Transcript_9624/g.29235  ORF Transcript_9624/g.29235 Transcript_9624/m.29235 type:complete len:223 (-) Transcript_9624:85-753(-)
MKRDVGRTRERVRHVDGLNQRSLGGLAVFEVVELRHADGACLVPFARDESEMPTSIVLLERGDAEGPCRQASERADFARLLRGAPRLCDDDEPSIATVREDRELSSSGFGDEHCDASRKIQKAIIESRHADLARDNLDSSDAVSRRQCDDVLRTVDGEAFAASVGRDEDRPVDEGVRFCCFRPRLTHLRPHSDFDGFGFAEDLLDAATARPEHRLVGVLVSM